MKAVAWVAKCILASSASAFAGAAAYPLALALFALCARALGSGSTYPSDWIFLPVAFLAASFVLFLGILAVGPVAYIFLRRARQDSAALASILGAGLATIGALALFFASTTGGFAVLLAIPAPLSGAVSGAVFRKLMLDYA